MRFLLRTLGVLFLVVLVAVAGIAGLYFAGRQPVPALDGAKAPSDVWLADGEQAGFYRMAHERIAELRREIGYPSVSAAIAIDGRVVWAEAQGYADLASARAATTETPYAIGSVSKSLTAAAVMRLVDRKQLLLDVDVRAYVPMFPPKQYAVTARQLLSHQAGIRHYQFAWNPPTFSDFGSNVQYPRVIDSLAPFANDPLLFEPDTSFTYSTYGYTLLSAAAERVAGVPFLDMMQAEVFGPVGMAHTGGDDKLHPAPGRASDYQNIARDDHVVDAPQTNSSGKWAGGGFRSTPRDLAAFGAALLDGKIVSAEGMAAMFTPRKLRDGKVNPQDYGLGFRVDMIADEAFPGKKWRAVHHGGVAVGSQAMLVLLPDERVVVAISVNASTAPPGRGMFDATTDIAVYYAQMRAR